MDSGTITAGDRTTVTTVSRSISFSVAALLLWSLPHATPHAATVSDRLACFAAFGAAIVEKCAPYHAARPDDVEVALQLGRELVALNRQEEAFKVYQATLKLNPGHAKLTDRLAFVQSYLEEEKFAEERRPKRDTSATQNRLNEIRCKKTKGEKAVTACQTALEAKPGDAVLLAALGSALLELGRHNEARDALNQALVSDPGNTDATAALASLDKVSPKPDTQVVVAPSAPKTAPKAEVKKPEAPSAPTQVVVVPKPAPAVETKVEVRKPEPAPAPTQVAKQEPEPKAEPGVEVKKSEAPSAPTQVVVAPKPAPPKTEPAVETKVEVRKPEPAPAPTQVAKQEPEPKADPKVEVKKPDPAPAPTQVAKQEPAPKPEPQTAVVAPAPPKTEPAVETKPALKEPETTPTQVAKADPAPPNDPTGLQELDQKIVAQLKLLDTLKERGLMKEDEYERRRAKLMDAVFKPTVFPDSPEQTRETDEPEEPDPRQIVEDLELGNYYAIVIGNNKYEYLPQLETAVNDAKVIANTLDKQYGFKVDLLLNATRYDVLRSMATLRRDVTENDSVLIYYAGHGILDEAVERGYWLPVDAEEDLNANWISAAEVTDYLKGIDAWHAMVVADSCYSGSLTRGSISNPRSGGDYARLLKRLATKRSRTVLTSGGLEPVADGGGDGHSVFARAFISTLQENNSVMEGQRLFTELRERVVLNAEQTPEYGNVRLAGHDGGDFLFVRKR